ncbi:hypothetical protein Q7689_00480 [Nocardiopsis tropica]|uniref:hypothetical protein n=1 Tax=Nocardiopsis tropica TaxID=109330 RepID=UPI002E8921A5|nr:hypothetical protein [Nocardiopsis tropica]
MEYRLKPRAVHAAQWNPRNPGPMTDLLTRHRLQWNTYRDGGLCVDPDHDGIGVHPTDWVVIDEDGPEAFTNARFHARHEAS